MEHKGGSDVGHQERGETGLTKVYTVMWNCNGALWTQPRRTQEVIEGQDHLVHRDAPKLGERATSGRGRSIRVNPQEYEASGYLERLKRDSSAFQT